MLIVSVIHQHQQERNEYCLTHMLVSVPTWNTSPRATFEVVERSFCLVDSLGSILLGAVKDPVADGCAKFLVGPFLNLGALLKCTMDVGLSPAEPGNRGDEFSWG
jgi:hypothetical protein